MVGGNQGDKNMAEDLPQSLVESKDAASSSTNAKAKSKAKANKTKKQMVPKAIPRQDHFMRLSYMYQIGNMEAIKGNETLSRAYLRGMGIVSQKTVLKMSSNIKRNVCKRCQRSLVSGHGNGRIRMVNQSKSQDPKFDFMEVECKCGMKKRYPVGLNRDYLPFSERPDVIYSPGDTVE